MTRGRCPRPDTPHDGARQMDASEKKSQASETNVGGIQPYSVRPWQLWGLILRIFKGGRLGKGSKLYTCARQTGLV
jgi:hypothetical protein